MSETISCSFTSEASSCSLDGIGGKIIPLVACKTDMKLHLLSLGVSKRRGGEDTMTEIQLILNRAGLFSTSNEELYSLTICPRHRKQLTIDWAGRKNNVCSYLT